MSKWRWLLRQFSKKLWLRAAFYCFGGILTAFIAPLVSGFLPDTFKYTLEENAVYEILKIIANSMLVVTTFSLSVMVVANTAANSNATPRAAKLILEDNTAQVALSAFIGSFLFSLVGIIALKTNIYSDKGQVILLAVTIVVIISVIMVLLRWINYLSKMGKVTSTINMVERAVKNAIDDWIERPYLGANKLGDYKPKKNHYPLDHPQIGYVQNINISSISKFADEHNLEIYLQVLSGNFNDSISPILYTSKKLNNKQAEDLRSKINIGHERDFEQDPRFGIIVLSEIASRALSPGVNDPGTAIDILGTAIRLLAPWVKAMPLKENLKYEKVHVPDIDMQDVFQDIFDPIARDGAGFAEVDIRLQKALASLSKEGGKEIKDLAKTFSALAMKRANAALGTKEDRDLLKKYAFKA